MNDSRKKTKVQLIAKLNKLRQCVAALDMIDTFRQVSSRRLKSWRLESAKRGWRIGR